MLSATWRAAFSSSSPPISPTSTISSVSGSASKRLEDVDEGRADDRVAADADDGRVAEPELGQLVADLVGQRPERETRPIAPAAKTSAGMIPAFALPGERTPGQFGPIIVTPFGRTYV